MNRDAGEIRFRRPRCCVDARVPCARGELPRPYFFIFLGEKWSEKPKQYVKREMESRNRGHLRLCTKCSVGARSDHLDERIRESLPEETFSFGESNVVLVVLKRACRPANEIGEAR